MNLAPIRRALISVSDKTNLPDLALALVKWKVEIISTGGTGKELSKLGVPWTPIEQFTGNPEAFQGRMKTISFQVASSLLFRRQDPMDCAQAQELGILPIDLVICNLYPFAQTARAAEATEEMLVENIDVGGPTMLRSAAKNFAAVTVCCSPTQYPQLIQQLNTYQGQSERSFRLQMALATFQHLCQYDSIIASTLENLTSGDTSSAPPTVHYHAPASKKLRYGENPHQQAWALPNWRADGLLSTPLLQGKELSYNNLLDADAALQMVSDLHDWNGQLTSVAIIKHLNPCGVASAASALEALTAAWAGDPISSFGSIICCSQEVGSDFANFLQDKFVEVIVAPAFSAQALNIFQKKKNLRLLAPALLSGGQIRYSLRSVSGGILVQEEDQNFATELTVVTKNGFSEPQLQVASFGLRVAKHLRSNAIALVAAEATGLTLQGAGMGNPNRLISLQQAVEKAQENGITNLADCVLISDAFFPFADNIELAHRHGIKYIVQPGGSIKDAEVIAACDQYQMAMIFTSRRHFRH